MEKKNSNPESKTLSRNVYNLIILDESGSMSTIFKPAISGVNETLQTIRNVQKENPGQNHFVTLVAFSSGNYNVIYDLTPAEKAVDITENQYRPSGMTPLFDTMGRAITELRGHLKEESDVALVTVITDGYENDSREYTGMAIKNLIETLRKENWVFTYIGANQDVEAVAASIAIKNFQAFEADEDGTNNMFEKERRARKKFFAKLSESPNAPMTNDIKEDYFDI